MQHVQGLQGVQGVKGLAMPETSARSAWYARSARSCNMFKKFKVRQVCNMCRVCKESFQRINDLKSFQSCFIHIFTRNTVFGDDNGTKTGLRTTPIGRVLLKARYDDSVNAP